MAPAITTYILGCEAVWFVIFSFFFVKDANAELPKLWYWIYKFLKPTKRWRDPMCPWCKIIPYWSTGRNYILGNNPPFLAGQRSRSGTNWYLLSLEQTHTSCPDISFLIWTLCLDFHTKGSTELQWLFTFRRKIIFVIDVILLFFFFKQQHRHKNTLFVFPQTRLQEDLFKMFKYCVRMWKTYNAF